MGDPYTKINQKKILAKVNRKRNPVRSLVELAHEFGVNTTFKRSNGATGHTAPKRFRKAVNDQVGSRVYSQIRDASKVRAA